MTEKSKDQVTPPSDNDTYWATLKAAAKLFRDQGYSATTLRQIAEKVGIKAGSIYYHFASKEEILDKVLETGILTALAEVQNRVNALPPDATSKERIAAAIEGHLFGILQHGDFVCANIRVYSQVSAASKRRHRAVRAVYASYWDNLFKECCEQGGLRGDISLSILRLFTIGALNWTVEWFDPRRSSVEDFVAQISTIVFDGILPHDVVAVAESTQVNRKARVGARN